MLLLVDNWEMKDLFSLTVSQPRKLIDFQAASACRTLPVNIPSSSEKKEKKDENKIPGENCAVSQESNSAPGLWNWQAMARARKKDSLNNK